MEKLTREDIAVIKCCLRAEIRLHEETLKSYTGDTLLDRTARADAEIEINRVAKILSKLEV